MGKITYTACAIVFYCSVAFAAVVEPLPIDGDGNLKQLPAVRVDVKPISLSGKGTILFIFSGNNFTDSTNRITLIVLQSKDGVNWVVACSASGKGGGNWALRGLGCPLRDGMTSAKATIEPTKSFDAGVLLIER